MTVRSLEALLVSWATRSSSLSSWSPLAEPSFHLMEYSDPEFFYRQIQWYKLQSWQQYEFIYKKKVQYALKSWLPLSPFWTLKFQKLQKMDLTSGPDFFEKIIHDELNLSPVIILKCSSRLLSNVVYCNQRSCVGFLLMF